MGTTSWFLRSSLLLSLALLAMPNAGRAAPPTLTYLFPAGAQQGQSVVLTAGGSFERWPVQAWVDRKGVDIKPVADKKGQLSVTVAADAVPGIYWMRLYDEQGASALRPFLVGTLPEILEQEPNDDPKKPQELPSSCVVVNGRLERTGDVDSFAVLLHKGETLVASVEANRTLGSPMDAVLQILSSDGFVLEQNNDDHGLDPQVVFTAPKEDRYVVRLFAFPATPDSSIRFAGGETYIYRLTLTTGGFADHALPLAVSRADPGTVSVKGWNIPPDARQLTVQPEPAADTVVLWHPKLANTIPVLLELHSCLADDESKDRTKPRRISLPVTISGHVDPPGVGQVYEFQAQKEQRLLFRADARSVGSQLDPVLRLSDVAGKLIAQADDTSTGRAGTRDAELAWTVPQDGVYRLEVRDQGGQGSFRHFYRLRVILAQPDYVLTLATDRFMLTPGKPLDIPVSVQRRQGFDREIEIVAEELPEGVTMTPAKAAAAGGKVMVRLEATNGPLAVPFRIVGRVAGQADFTRTATATGTGLMTATPHLWLSVTK